MSNPHEGESLTPTQAGLTGRNTALVGNGNAIAAGVLGTSDNVAAVYGEQRGNGTGVTGIAKGKGTGVYGTSTSGPAGYFQGDVEITGKLTVQGKGFEDKIATIKQIFEGFLSGIRSARDYVGQPTLDLLNSL